MMNTEEDNYLQMSGIQHFAFCRRQWALAYMEMQWHENVRTAEGRLDHTRCHDESAVEKRGDILILRGMRVSSKRLCLSGTCDVVEFHKDEQGIMLNGYEGKWKVVPIEYKHGHSKMEDVDRLQLTAEVMALEEMLVCDIPVGYLYYIETRKREKVIITDSLRNQALVMAKEMNDCFDRRYTPKVKVGPFCNACSLKEICVPKLCTKMDVTSYISDHIEEKV